jgi:hypothetical protein
MGYQKVEMAVHPKLSSEKLLRKYLKEEKE